MFTLHLCVRAQLVSRFISTECKLPGNPQNTHTHTHANELSFHARVTQGRKDKKKRWFVQYLCLHIYMQSCIIDPRTTSWTSFRKLAPDLFKLHVNRCDIKRQREHNMPEITIGTSNQTAWFTSHTSCCRKVSSCFNTALSLLTSVGKIIPVCEWTMQNLVNSCDIFRHSLDADVQSSGVWISELEPRSCSSMGLLMCWPEQNCSNSV